MNDSDMTILLNHVADLREEIEAIKRALARMRIYTGHTGNQWMAIPPAPKNGEGDGGEAPQYVGVPKVVGRDASPA
jgi:hypothetical protein